MNRENWLIELSHRPQPREPRLVGRDVSNPYYDFLYYLAAELKPNCLVELGTYNGHSAIHFALGWPEGTVTTIDVELMPATRERLSPFANVTVLEGNSTSGGILAKVRKQAPVDILFIDTLHEKEQVEKELACYLPLVKSGGIIAFDDLRINAGMAQFWDELTLEKLNLNHLHASGFGVAFAP